MLCCTSPEEKDIIEVSQEVSAIIENIVEARMKSGLTQRDLAKLCGVKQSAIARMERIQAIPRLDTLVKIARKVGIKICTSFVHLL